MLNSCSIKLTLYNVLNTRVGAKNNLIVQGLKNIFKYLNICDNTVDRVRMLNIFMGI